MKSIVKQSSPAKSNIATVVKSQMSKYLSPEKYYQKEIYEPIIPRETSPARVSTPTKEHLIEQAIASYEAKINLVKLNE